MFARSPAVDQPSAKRRCLSPAFSTMQSPPQRPTISLTPEEETVRKLLVDVAAEIDAEAPENDEPLTLRFTGGWVRDKLLGEQSHDIDVGINKMTGFAFATRLGQFLTEKQQDYNIATRSIHKIESNPEKSKHLETATTKILGLDIDFVNLRSETYCDDSRIPLMVCTMSAAQLQSSHG
jgi:tRNA nucleotidyltransferase (CCA-adding enzyme)